MLPVEVISDPVPTGETNADPGQFSALNVASCCVEFRHGKMTRENPSPLLLAVQAKHKVQNLHSRITNTRRDYFHQVSTTISKKRSVIAMKTRRY